MYGAVIGVARDKPIAEEMAENVSGVPSNANVLVKKESEVRVPWDDSLRLLDVKDILTIVEEQPSDVAH